MPRCVTRQDDTPMATQFLTPQPGRGASRLFVLALACVSLSVAGAEKDYTVKRNDTLTDLAHRNGLTVSQLAGRNGLAKSDKLRVGQKLVIPDSETAKSEAASSWLLPKEL